ncbi:MAG TPA: class II aldolase/adducin family protein [Chloroflexota bacterium]|jgi:L-fuculose-phosphate aldolase
MPSHDDERALKEALVQACHILAMEGQSNTILGHMAARLPGWDRFWMKPSRMGLEEIAEDDLVLVGLDGALLAGHRDRHAEYPIHAEIMRARPDVLATVHTHPIHSVAFAARGRPLRSVGHEGSYFCPPGVPVFDRKTDLILTAEEGRWVSDALGDARGVFLLNHGIAVPGPTVEHACVAAIMLEHAARTQLLAESDGAEARYTPDWEAPTKQLHAVPPERLPPIFAYYTRKLARWDHVPRD